MVGLEGEVRAVNRMRLRKPGKLGKLGRLLKSERFGKLGMFGRSEEEDFRMKI